MDSGILFLNALQKLVPTIKGEDIIPSNKIGIRPQVYDLKSQKLLQDFLIEKTKSSLHVLNAISPAFTASFEFADYLIEESKFF